MSKLLYTNDESTKARYEAQRIEAYSGLLFVGYVLLMAGACLGCIMLLVGVL